MAVKFSWEKLEVLLSEPNCRELITEYWEELWPYKKEIPLDVDWDLLSRYEADGVFRVWSARVGGTLAGFVSFYIQPYILAKTTILALDGGHYLSPEFRNRLDRLGYRMYKTAGIALKAEGAKLAMLHDNAARPLLPLFLAIGASPRSIIYWWFL